ncbi:MAG TPA: SDR family oxidoreductase [Pirellulaceae bacterium]|nr:SDR family oxidoreductase [Pirellulaceae bacterium]
MTMDRSASAFAADTLTNTADPAWSESGIPINGSHGNSPFILLTGATGFLGQYLLRDLIKAGAQVAVIVRSGTQVSARERIRQALNRWREDLAGNNSEVVVLPGDVTKPHLGLSWTARKWVRKHCCSLVHNAASVNFAPAERDREPWITNLRGTEQVLRFCLDHDIHDLHHVSTAYVCGVREGLIRESELACGQSFRNPYEASKCEAEQLVQTFDLIGNRTIYRPSIITGDSRTGETCTYHGMMWYLRLFDLLIPQQPLNARGRHQTDIVLPIDGDEPHDVVNVDWVSNAMVRLIKNPAARNRVFHVTASQPTTIRQVVDYCCEYYNSEGVVYAGRHAGRHATSDFADLVFRMAQAYHGYEQSAPQFDRSQLLEFLPHDQSPVIDRDMVFRFIEFGRRDRWGKQRRQWTRQPASFEPTVRLALVE